MSEDLADAIVRAAEQMRRKELNLRPLHANIHQRIESFQEMSTTPPHRLTTTYEFDGSEFNTIEAALDYIGEKGYVLVQGDFVGHVTGSKRGGYFFNERHKQFSERKIIALFQSS